MRNEIDSSVEGLFWGRLALTLFPVQLVRSRAIQCVIFFCSFQMNGLILVTRLNLGLGNVVTYMHVVRLDRLFSVVTYIFVILKQIKRMYCEINWRWATYLFRNFKCFMLFQFFFTKESITLNERKAQRKIEWRNDKNTVPFLAWVYFYREFGQSLTRKNVSLITYNPARQV